MCTLTLERLEHIRHVTDQLRTIDKQIYYAYDTRKSPSLESISKHSIGTVSDPVRDAVHAVDVLEQRKAECLQEMLIFEQDLSEIGNNEIEAIIRWHYLLGYGWKETSRMVYGSCDYFRARNTLRRYLAKE